MMAVSPWKWHLTSSHESLIKASYIGKNDVSVVGKYNLPLNVFLLASYYYGNKLVQFVILQTYYLVLEVKSLKIKVSTRLHSLWMMQVEHFSLVIQLLEATVSWLVAPSSISKPVAQFLQIAPSPSLSYLCLCHHVFLFYSYSPVSL